MANNDVWKHRFSHKDITSGMEISTVKSIWTTTEKNGIKKTLMMKKIIQTIQNQHHKNSKGQKIYFIQNLLDNYDFYQNIY